VCVVCYTACTDIYKLLLQTVDQFEVLLQSMCSRCPSCAETQAVRQTFTPLSYGTVSQLLINLVPFIRDALLQFFNASTLIIIINFNYIAAQNEMTVS